MDFVIHVFNFNCYNNFSFINKTDFFSYREKYKIYFEYQSMVFKTEGPRINELWTEKINNNNLKIKNKKLFRTRRHIESGQGFTKRESGQGCADGEYAFKYGFGLAFGTVALLFFQGLLCRWLETLKGMVCMAQIQSSCVTKTSHGYLTSFYCNCTTCY